MLPVTYYFPFLICLGLVVATSVEPIWLSPKNATSNKPEFADAVKNEWTSIDFGAAGRADVPIVHVDSKGTIWIMGSSGLDHFMNAVWNYDPVTDLYRWVAGRVDSPTVEVSQVGEFGVPGPDVYFRGQDYCASTIDHNDNIWIYGSSAAPQNQFWMFNTTSYQFTFFGLDVTSPYYDEFGTPSPNNYPGSLEGASLVADSLNNLWLLGGWRSSNTRNHVWHFNTTSWQWSFMWGETSSVYPIDFSTNYWNGRWLPGVAIDDEDRIWVFGGYGSPPVGSVVSIDELDWADLWSFDTKTLDWRVEWGNESSFYSAGAVANPDAYDIGNFPRSRDGAAMVDRLDGTLLVGGGFDNGDGQVGLNDFWLFDKTTKLWKLVYGSVAPGSVATEWTNYRSVGGKLGSHEYHSRSGGVHNRGNLVLYGGQVDSFAASDIWLFPQDQCVADLNECDVNAACSSGPSVMSICTCNEGYTGDGKTCTEVVDPPQTAPETPVSSGTPTGSSAPSAPTTAPAAKTSGTVNNAVVSIFGMVIISFIFI